MAGSFKTEAVVLRSIRFGEADRVLHLYSADRGRVGAVAKGVRRVKSRLGGRLEPLSRVRLVLHEGRGELCTVSAVDSVNAHPALREQRASLERASQACEAVLRLFDSAEPNRAAYNLLCNQLALLDTDPAAATRAQSLAFRAKLLLAAGFAPELASCATCGEADHLSGFSPSAGGVVCSGCEAGSFPHRRPRPSLHGRGAGAAAGRGARRTRPRAGPGRPRAGGDAGASRPRAPAPRGLTTQA